MTQPELEYLRKVYLKAEVDIINEISRLRSKDLIDFHTVATLQRVQQILLNLQDVNWKYIPKMIEREFYAQHPDKYTRAVKSVKEHLLGYENAAGLTAAELDAAQRLTFSIIEDFSAASVNIMTNLSKVLIGRDFDDFWRKEGLEATLRVEVGIPFQQSKAEMIDEIRRMGVTAFTDKAERDWSLHAYADMVLRTTAKQASNQAILLKDPEQDLYYIPKIGTTCKICAPLEGRVFTKSGQDRRFPPLALAFGKRSAAGPNTLDNSWLNIHPNCLHPLIPYNLPEDKQKQLEIIRSSSTKTNPLSTDPRSKAEIEAYRKKEAGRQKWLEDFKQFEKYRLAIPNQMPKTFQTFQKHKLAGDTRYESWVTAYKKVTK